MAVRSRWLRTAIVVFAALVLVAAIQRFVVSRPYLIPSRSMEPTLAVGDRVILDELTPRLRAPRRGDVVVFAAPPSWSVRTASPRSSELFVRGLQNLGALVGLVPADENDLVKRVIATGGQTVSCCDARGRVTVDGVALDEPYVHADFPFIPGALDCTTVPRSRRCFPAVTVPPGRLWVMGDNRADSQDSRAHVADEFQGAVAIQDVRGAVWLRLWPPHRVR